MQFSHGFAVSADLRNTLRLFYREACNSSRFSAILPREPRRALQDSWLAKPPYLEQKVGLEPIPRISPSLPREFCRRFVPGHLHTLTTSTGKRQTTPQKATNESQQQKNFNRKRQTGAELSLFSSGSVPNAG